MTARKARISVTNELKSLILNMANSSEECSIAQIGQALNLSKSAVRRIINEHYDGIEFQPSTIKRKKTWETKTKLLTDAENVLFNAVACNNALTQTEMASEVANATSISLSQPSISRKLKKLSITRKRLTLVPEERNSPVNIEKRAIYASKIGRIMPEKYVFLDESGFNNHVRRRYGYSYVNQRAYAVVPGNRNTNKSLLCAIGIEGVISYEYRTGAYNGELLKTFIETKLAPYFNQNPDHILIMDNVPFHKSRIITESLNQFRINREYLPPWSPMLNPIEEFFSMVKSKYRGIKTLNKSITIEQALDEILSEGNNYSVQCHGFWRSMLRWLETARQKIPFQN